MSCRRILSGFFLCLAGLATSGCGSDQSLLRDIETSWAATNLSTRHYVVFQIREHADGAAEEDYVASPLLAPGATHRVRFLDILGVACPARLDLRVFAFARVDEDVPIGLDPEEQVESLPHAAGEVMDLPACDTDIVETYTVVNWEAPRGMARVKIAQATEIDQIIRESGRFANVDAAWETAGVDDSLVPPETLPAAFSTIAGEVIDQASAPVAGVGVLLRSRFRIRLDDQNETNDPDAGFGPPISVTETAADGSFVFDRPAGAYRVELFSDELAFRPAVIDLETPSARIVVVAEPIP